MSKITKALQLYPYGNSGRQRVNTDHKMCFILD